MPAVIPVIAGLTFAQTIAVYAFTVGFLAIASQTLAGRKGLGLDPIRERQVMLASATEPRITVLGRTVKSGVRTYSNTKDGKLYLLLVLAEGPVHKIGDIWFDNEKVGALDANGMVTSGRFSGKARIRKYTGTTSQTADPDLMADFPTQWTAEHRLLGLAYIVVTFWRDDAIYTNGAPTPRAEIFGVEVEDPRDGVVRYTDNAALLLRYYLRHHRGATEAELDDASWIAAANVCDEWVSIGLQPALVSSVDTGSNTLTLTAATAALEDGMRCKLRAATTYPTGFDSSTYYYVIVVSKNQVRLASSRQNAIQHTAMDFSDTGAGLDLWDFSQARYTANGLFTSEQQPREIVTRLGAAMGNSAGCIPSQGIYKCFPGAYVAPSRTLTISDLRGPIAVNPRAASKDAFNEIHGTFVDPLADWQDRDFPPVKNAAYVTADYGIVSSNDVDFPYALNEVRAQRLAKIELERHRQAITVQWPGKIKLFDVAPGDRVNVTVEHLGWSAKTFRVEKWELSPDFGVDLLLVEEAASIYDWNGGEATHTDPAPDTNLPNPWQMAAPTGLALDSGTSHLLMGSDGTLISRIFAAWSYGESPHATGFEIRYKKTAESAWTYQRLPLDARAAYLVGVQDGVAYDVAIRAVSQLAVTDWVASTHTVVGKTAAPSNVSNFTHVVNPAGILLTWSPIADADADLYEIRLGASYDTGTRVAQTRATEYQHGLLASGTGNFWIKAIDTSGNVSATATQRAVTVTAPGTPNLTGSIDAADYVLSWPAVGGSFPIRTYEVRHGASYAAGTFVASVAGTSLKRPVDWSGARTFWVAAIDSGDNTGTAASIALTIAAPIAPTVNASVVGPDALLEWSIPAATLPIEQYEVRYGTDFASGTSLGKVKATVFRFRAEWLGARAFWIAAIDTAGNVGTAGSAGITVVAPAVPVLSPLTIDNQFGITWTEPAATLPIAYYEVRRGASFGGANSLGFLTARVYNGFEIIAGSYTYWVVAYDTAGNIGTETNVAITVGAPTVTVYESVESAFGGTFSNAFLSGPDVIFPVDTAETWTDYAANGYTSIADELSAGFDAFLEPSAASGYYEETIDHGASVATSNVSVNATTQVLDGSPTITCLISHKLNSGDAWTDLSAGFTGSIGTAARYFKVRITCSSSGNDDLASLDVLQILITS